MKIFLYINMHKILVSSYSSYLACIINFFNKWLQGKMKLNNEKLKIAICSHPIYKLVLLIQLQPQTETILLHGYIPSKYIILSYCQ